MKMGALVLWSSWGWELCWLEVKCKEPFHAWEHSVLSVLPVASCSTSVLQKIFAPLPSIRFGRITWGRLVSVLSQPGPLLTRGPDEGTAYFKEQF